MGRCFLKLEANKIIGICSCRSEVVHLGWWKLRNAGATGVVVAVVGVGGGGGGEEF